MEGAPAHLDPEEIGRSLRGLSGVAGVHDLHLWSLGGSAPLLTAHLVVDLSVNAHEVLRTATAELSPYELLTGLRARVPRVYEEAA